EEEQVLANFHLGMHDSLVARRRHAADFFGVEGLFVKIEGARAGAADEVGDESAGTGRDGASHGSRAPEGVEMGMRCAFAPRARYPVVELRGRDSTSGRRNIHWWWRAWSLKRCRLGQLPLLGGEDLADGAEVVG